MNDETILSNGVEVQLSTVTPGALPELDSRYENLGQIGQGGMSVVYKARHRLMNTLVAIKVLHEKLVGDGQHVKRFQVEAKAAGRLDHHNLIKVLDFGLLSDGSCYLVMDFAEGRSLGDVVRTDGALEIDAALELFLQICSGLQHAHEKGVLHRDLKPSNVIVSNDDNRIKVVDFGIAKVQASEDGGFDPKLTATGEVFGSPYYMSPEQCMGQTVDARSDIYSMGCLMYEVVTGKLPLMGANVFETIHKQVHDTAEPLTKYVSGEKANGLSFIVEKTLAKNPSDRYQSFAELTNDLTALTAGRKLRKGYGLKLSRVSRAQSIAVAFACILLLGVIICSLMHVGPFSLPTQPPPAVPAATEPTHDTRAELPASELVKIELEHYKTKGKITVRTPDVLDNSFVQLLAQEARGKSLILKGQPRIDDVGMQAFTNHPAVEVLELDGSNITDKTLEALTTCPHLHKLTLSNTKVTPDGFKYLAQIPALREVWLADLNLTDQDLEKFPNLPNLHRLKVDYNPKITDKGISLLARKCPKLTYLGARWTQMSDQSVPALLQLKKLRELKTYKTQITQVGARALLSQNYTRCITDFSPIIGTHLQKLGDRPAGDSY
jgi:tRNA A-37 threonylcarbamoyl transferase component Bud32